MSNTINMRLLAIALSTVLLTACGGSGNDSPDTTPGSGSGGSEGGGDGGGGGDGSGDDGGGNDGDNDTGGGDTDGGDDGDAGDDGDDGAGDGTGVDDGAGDGAEDGDDGDGDADDDGEDDPVEPPPPFPEPTSARYDEIDVGGFYDVDAQGRPRAVRNDLAGSLGGMVQFAQSHTVDPSGNGPRHMPTLTTERAALLLVTPDPALGELESLTVTVTVDGTARRALAMRHPNAMYRSDYNDNQGRPDYNYSRRAWSVHLPWNWVKPGMSLSVTDDQGRTGTLAADRIEFAAPAELVVQSIRLGMLTDPPAQTNDHWLLAQPEQGASDYFQTIPAARLTVAYYEPMRLDRVMVRSGTIYDTASAVNGDVYSGDMREDVGKSTVSIGANLANIGVTSSGMAGQSQPALIQYVLAHHNVGMYANGRQSHGLSGGNGMLTIYASRGNEFSHEIGHHYGLGHYPGQNGSNYFWAGHHHDSGWGYIAYRKRMRANLHWSRGKDAGMQGMPVFEDTYSFGTDAMAGGHYSSALSHYTHYTGYSTQQRIQPNLDRVVPDATSSTGYRKWDRTTRRMEEWSGTVPNNGQLFFNTPDGRYLKPRLVGVPVFTVYGGYDPDNGNALLYPAFRGNWGNVFNLPQPASDATARQCWLEVQFANGSSRRIAVAGRRMQADSVNKLHVNIAQADAPREARLQCSATGTPNPSTLASMTFPQGLPPMAPPVVVGKEAGYAALRTVELPELDAALVAAAGRPVIDLGARGNLLYASWGDDPTGLSATAREVHAAYAAQEERATRLNRWMNRYRSDLLASDSTAAVAALKELLQRLGMLQTPLLPSGGPMLVTTAGHCLKTERKGDALGVYIAEASSCTGAREELWMADARGAIHSVAHPTMCLSGAGGNNAPVGLARCDRTQAMQAFDLGDLPRITRAGRCLDLATGRLTNGRASLITYNCSGGNNQRWTGLQPSTSLVLALLSPANLDTLLRLDLD